MLQLLDFLAFTEPWIQLFSVWKFRNVKDALIWKAVGRRNFAQIILFDTPLNKNKLMCVLFWCLLVKCSRPIQKHVNWLFQYLLFRTVVYTGLDDWCPQQPLGMRVEVSANCLNRLLKYWRTFMGSSIFNNTLIIKGLNPSKGCRLSSPAFSVLCVK